MQNNLLRMAIRSTAAAAMMGVAAQAGAFSFNAGDVEASVYGYAQLNASYDINESIGTAGYGSFGDVSGSEIEGNFAAYAQQSRFGITATNSAGVKTNVEGDFLGGTFRLRHAYGEYNGVLMGRTWSNYNSFVGNTGLFDFNGQAAVGGTQGRTAQVRYTTGPMSFSIEQPGNSAIVDTTGTFAVDADNVVEDRKTGSPAVTARLQDSQGGLSYAAAVMAKQNTVDNGTDEESGMGFGTFASLKMEVSDMISVQGSLGYTSGASSYLYQSGASDGYVDANGDLENTDGFGGAIGTGIGLGGGRSINVGAGMIEMDLDDGGSGDESRRNVFANYTWSPVEKVSMAVELSNWRTEDVAGNSESASRVMYVSRYSF